MSLILEQHYLACLSQASYLIADPESKVAAVVDPRRDIDLYTERAKELGVEIRHVILTHFHADFLAGHLGLRALGATVHLGAKAEAEFPFEPLADGAILQLGDVRIQALETPGHTPESICLLVFEPGKEEPHAVLTGDTLFIGDVGRPDLLASLGHTAEELGSQLYDSLHTKLLPLPDETLLYPGHGAGSACGKSLSTETVCTIGRQRQFNYALQPMDKEAFVAIVTAGQPTQPAYFAYDAVLNRKEHATLAEALGDLEALSLEDVRRLQNEGAQILDVSSPDDFAAGHLPGSLNVGLGGRFASWAGAVLDSETRVVLVGPPGSEREAATRLGRIGFDRIAGYLEGGMDAERRGTLDDRSSVRRWTAQSLREALASDSPPHVLDVRTPGEREESLIEGSQFIPLVELPGRLDEVDGSKQPIVVHCRGGYRSMIAASLLLRAGIQVDDLEGGIASWQLTAKAS